MSGLLPSESDGVAAGEASDDGGTRLLWLDDEEVEPLIGSLSSATARSLLTALHEEPRTASELAEVVDTSLQNVRHHVGNLQDADLVEVAETRYSVKGRERKVSRDLACTRDGGGDGRVMGWVGYAVPVRLLHP